MPSLEFPQSRCHAAVARRDITPPVGMYHRMWGAATHEVSTGIHRPLSATVLYLRDLTGAPANQHIVIAIDHCLFWTAEMNALLHSISDATGVVRDQLTVFFSHTHGAGLIGLDRTALTGGHLIPGYLDDLARQIGEMILDTGRRLEPASITYGTGRCDLATNRDFFDQERGRFVCGFNPDGVADETVVVARIANGSDQTLATLVNYACHPTTLAWENTLISPDYIGAMRDVVEAATSSPCIFIQGASGDIGPREGFVGDVQVADRNGLCLGYAALAAIEALPQPGQAYSYVGPVLSGATLGIWKYQSQSEVSERRQATWSSRRPIIPLRYRDDLPVQEELNQDLVRWRSAEEAALAKGDELAARDAHAMVERTNRKVTRVANLPAGPDYPFPLVARRIGDAVWLAFDGEHYNVLQRTLRERFPHVTLIIGTIANGSNVWYLPDADSYGKGLYQEEVSILQRGCLETVIEAATELIREMLA